MTTINLTPDSSIDTVKHTLENTPAEAIEHWLETDAIDPFLVTDGGRAILALFLPYAGLQCRHHQELTLLAAEKGHDEQLGRLLSFEGALTQSILQQALEKARGHASTCAMLEGLLSGALAPREDLASSHSPTFDESIKELGPESQVGDVISFGLSAWRILDAQGPHKLLLAESPLPDRCFHDSASDATWESCSLRKWLNCEYVQGESFSDAERNMIEVTRIPSDTSVNSECALSSASEDMLFLLSVEEVQAYITDKTERACGAVWWLRTPGLLNSRAAFVWLDGTVNIDGWQNVAAIGVRPAMWVAAPQ